MHLATFQTTAGSSSWGVVRENTVVDLPALAAANGQPYAASVLEFLREDRPSWPTELIDSATDVASHSHSLDDVKLLAPIPRPGKIVAIGRNYLDHVGEASLTSLPEWPKLFPKFPSNVVGPGDDIIKPTMTQQFDWELEVGIVIGRTARNVSEAAAMDYVAGYTVLNDISARDVQMADDQLTLGKNFATSCPMGPVLTTVEDLPDPHGITIRLRLNGQQMQSARTDAMIFSIPYLVSFLSYVMGLEPGDVIASGTPAGVGVFRKPPVFLKAGDVIESEIDGIGTLVNTIVEGTGVAPRPSNRS